MVFNKKANSFTNIYVLLTVLLLVAIFSVSIIKLGIDFANNDNTNLNEQSITFIVEESGNQFHINNRSIESNSFLSDSQKSDQFYADEDTVGDNPKDFALEFFYGLSTAQKVWNTIKSIYALPTFFIRWLPLDAVSFEIVINAFNLFFWASLLGAILFVVRGYNIGGRS